MSAPNANGQVYLLPIKVYMQKVLPYYAVCEQHFPMPHIARGGSCEYSLLYRSVAGGASKSLRLDSPTLDPISGRSRSLAFSEAKGWLSPRKWVDQGLRARNYIRTSL